jgi:hypothetical protein
MTPSTLLSGVVRPAILSAAGVSLAAFLLASRSTAEPSKSQCVDADTQAQQLRRDERLAAAREQLHVCADPACPALVRDDCAQRLDELGKAQPTLVFEIKNGDGRDLADVRISLDGQALGDTAPGAAIPVDPGTHTFRFEAKGELPVTRQLVLHEGDKARHERVVIGALPPSSTGYGQRTAGLLVGGLGVVGLGLGVVFGALAASRWSTAHADCPSSPSCTPSSNIAATSEHSSAVTLATGSTVSFIAGGILAAGGVVLYVTAPSGSDNRSKKGFQILPAGSPAGGGVSFRGRF